MNIEDSARTTNAEISYLAEGSFINRRYVSAGQEVNTGSYEAHTVLVRDGRPYREQFSLDEQGFVLADHESVVTDFTDNAEVEKAYPAESEALIKTLTGADLVVCRGWMVRTSGDIEKKQVENYRHHGGVQPPAAEAHVDFTRETATAIAEQTFREHFPGEKPFKRFLSLSLWRTFSPPPQDWPLALCDARSVGPDEGAENALVVVDEIPDEAAMRGELENEDQLMKAYIFRYNPGHRWWYFSNMTRDEVLLFKFYDSDESGAWRVPHTAFPDSSFPDAKVRRSIELRSFAYFL